MSRCPLPSFVHTFFVNGYVIYKRGQRIMKLKITNGKVSHYLFLQSTLQLHKCALATFPF